MSGGVFSTSGEDLKIAISAAASKLDMAGNSLQAAAANNTTVGADLRISGQHLKDAANQLLAAVTAQQRYMDDWLEKFITAKNARD